MNPVRLGIIGCGVIGSNHIRSAKEVPELIDLVAISDLREEVLKDTAEKNEIPKTFTEGDALLEDDDIEAVTLAMPAHLRTALGLKAFANGKHVLTEKPVAMNASEVQQLIDARGELVGACCSSRMRFSRAADAVTEIIRCGELGPIRSVHCRAAFPAQSKPEAPPPAWRLNRSLNGGGILMNWGCYDLDYLLGLCDWQLEPQKVFAQTWPVAPHLEGNVAPGSDAETHYNALIRCKGGTVLSLERGEHMALDGEGSWQIVGTRGSLRLLMTGRNQTVWHDRADAAEGLQSVKIYDAEEESGYHLRGPVQDFCVAIRESRAPKTTLEQALVVQKISDGIYKSAESGEAVEI